MSIFGDVALNLKARLATNMSPVTQSTEVMSSDSAHAAVRFPVPWTVRVQTPVRRVPPGKNWSGNEDWVPLTYGGPQ